MKYKLENLIASITEFILRYLHVVSIAIGLAIYFLFIKIFKFNSIDYTNIPSVCASFAGFLLTSYTIVNSLNDNKFTKILRQNPTFKAVLKLIIYSAILQLTTTVASVLGFSHNIVSMLFIVSMVETVVAFHCVFKIYNYSNQSSQ